jgi:hypothetical protein
MSVSISLMSQSAIEEWHELRGLKTLYNESEVPKFQRKWKRQALSCSLFNPFGRRAVVVVCVVTAQELIP